MPRPPLPRRVCCAIGVRGFRPIGKPACATDLVTIGRDELEAIRLADLEGLYQEAAAERMGVSRPTFARIVTHARALVADALVAGKALLVEPGAAVDGPAVPMGCPVHDGARRRGRGCRCERGPQCGSRNGLPAGGQVCHRRGPGSGACRSGSDPGT
jgi:predicted DNA-binding protein (UPF0251 family)